MKQAMINYTRNEKYDHFDTPAYAIKPLLDYIPKKWVVWEPTDTTGKSKITEVFRKRGSKVISTGQKKIDFLKNYPDFKFDCIITNPPYSLKDEFIERCYEYTLEGKKWALLLPLTALEGIWRGTLLGDLRDRFGLLVFNRRVEFTGKSVWFNTSWFCSGILPQQLMFTNLVKE